MSFQPLHFIAGLRTRWPMLAALGVACAAVYSAAFWLRFEGEIPGDFQRTLWSTLPLAAAAKLLAFVCFRGHQGWGRYATFPDLINLAKSATVGSLLVSLINIVLQPAPPIPRSVLLIDWFATIVVVGGLRTAIRLLHERNLRWGLRGKRKPVLIVGANDAGESLIRAIYRTSQLAYRVVGFVDDDPHKLGRHISGVPVLGTTAQACQLAASHGGCEILITAGELSGRTVRTLVEECRQAGLSVKVLPSYEQLIAGRVDIKARDVCIDDLLRREPVQLDLAHIQEGLTGRVLMVTGSAGSIGSEICRQLARFEFERLVLVDRSENGQFFLARELAAAFPQRKFVTAIADVRDVSSMRALFARVRPQVVFHAAAFKHVPLMEDHPGEAVKNNVLGTRTVVDLADEFAAESFVMVSTDKAVNPTSVMGATKRAAELYVQSKAAHTGRRFVTVRFGNVLDSAGSVVPIFREQIRKGGPVTITDPRMVRFFMTIPEAAQLVIQAGALGAGGEIFVLDMGEPVKIVDLARDMVRLSGLKLDEDIEIKVVGMRPGEKLYEELYGTGEEHLPTRHPKIQVAKGAALGYPAAIEAMQRLADAADGPGPAVVAALESVVLDFQRPAGAGGLRLFESTPEAGDDRRAAA